MLQLQSVLNLVSFTSHYQRCETRCVDVQQTVINPNIFLHLNFFLACYMLYNHRSKIFTSLMICLIEIISLITQNIQKLYKNWFSQYRLVLLMLSASSTIGILHN